MPHKMEVVSYVGNYQNLEKCRFVSLPALGLPLSRPTPYM